MYYIFDDPSYGFLAAAAVEIGAFIYISVSQRRFRHLALLTGIILGIMVWGLDQAVETNREQADTLTRKVVEATVKPNSGFVVGSLHETMEIGGVDRDQMAATIRTFLRKKQFNSHTVKSLEVLKADDNKAVVEFTVLTVFDQNGDYAMGGMTTSKWQFTYARSQIGKYKITDIEMLSINNGAPPVNWQKEIK